MLVVLKEVYYLGVIDKCVPIIESEKNNNIQYETSSVSNDLITKHSSLRLLYT